jgi:hypothetical protein
MHQWAELEKGIHLLRLLLVARLLYFRQPVPVQCLPEFVVYMLLTLPAHHLKKHLQSEPSPGQQHQVHFVKYFVLETVIEVPVCYQRHWLL